MTIDSPQDLAGLKRIGRIVGLALKKMQKQVKPGVTTAELDVYGAALLERYRARSAPILVYQFPGTICISVNAELDGYFADAAVTVEVTPVDSTRHNLVLCAQQALNNAIATARAGQAINSI